MGSSPDRKVCSLMKCFALKTGFALAGLFAGSLLLGSGAQAQEVPDLSVCVGYADTFRNAPPAPQFPNPWMGSSEVQYFAGQATADDGTFDAGAIHFENDGLTPIVIKGLTVDHFHGGLSYSIWNSFIGSGLSLDPGKIAIFTQIGGTENFDTSDTPNLNTTPNTDQPQIHLTTGTGTFTYLDSKQILNTGGIDRATLNSTNTFDESLGWRPIGTTGVEDVNGFDCQISPTPEPSGLALLFTGGLPLLGFLRRRRAA